MDTGLGGMGKTWLLKLVWNVLLVSVQFHLFISPYAFVEMLSLDGSLNLSASSYIGHNK